MLKTLNEFLEEGVEIYPEIVDDTTKAVITDWFGYRKVANNRYFPNWFYRILVRDYPRYQEILRVEARTAGSEYDWLVTNYEERQVETSGNESSSNTGSSTMSRESNKTFTAGTSQVTTDNNTDNVDGTVTSAHSGTDNNLTTKNLAHGGTERYQKDASGSSTNIRTANLQYGLTGQEVVDEDTANNNTRTPNIVNESKNSGTDSSRHGTLQREAPYDADYTGLTDSTNANVAHGINDDGVDVGTPDMLNSSGFMAGFPALVIANPTSTSDEVTNNANVNMTKNSETGTETNNGTGTLDRQIDRTETRTETGTDTNATTTSNDEDNLTTRNLTETGTENNARTVDLTDTDTTDTTTTHTGRSETVNSGSNRDVTTESGSDSNQSATTATKSGLERTIYTGRSGQSPQLLLTDAVEFIKSTSAWLWLYRQLDKCFMMLYDLDEYEEV